MWVYVCRYICCIYRVYNFLYYIYYSYTLLLCICIMYEYLYFSYYIYTNAMFTMLHIHLIYTPYVLYYPISIQSEERVCASREPTGSDRCQDCGP